MNGKRGKSVRRRMFTMGFHHEVCCGAGFKRSPKTAKYYKRLANRLERRDAMATEKDDA